MHLSLNFSSISSFRVRIEVSAVAFLLFTRLTRALSDCFRWHRKVDVSSRFSVWNTQVIYSGVLYANVAPFGDRGNLLSNNNNNNNERSSQSPALNTALKLTANIDQLRCSLSQVSAAPWLPVYPVLRRVNIDDVLSWRASHISLLAKRCNYRQSPFGFFAKYARCSNFLPSDKTPLILWHVTER